MFSEDEYESRFRKDFPAVMWSANLSTLAYD